MFKKIIGIISSGRMLSAFFMGFSCGLPLALTGGTLQAWMTDEKINLTVIGLFSLVGLPYTLKFLWAPLVDRYVPPLLGRRRGWLLLFQVAIILSLIGLSLCQIQSQIYTVGILALCVAFFSASQDIVVDAYRRETLLDVELGLGSGLYVNGYLLAFRFVSGALAILLATWFPWKTVYLFMAGLMLVGVLTTMLSEEPKITGLPPKSLKQAVILPFSDFFSRKGAFLLLTFILLYKIGDNLAQAMTVPFVLGQGYSKAEYAGIVKTFGFVAILVGGMLGGALLLRMKIWTGLLIFGVLQMVSTFGFSLLALTPVNLSLLTVVIAFENLSAGMGTSAYSAYMAKLTNKQFTATQYALLSSVMGIPRVVLSAPTGYFAKEMGFFYFFIFCGLIAIPGLLLLFKIRKL